MRKGLTVVLMLLVSVSVALAEGGLYKSALEVGGSTSVRRTSGPLYGNTASTFRFAPTAGYMIVDNLSVGFGMDYTTVKSGRIIDDRLTFGPFCHFYLHKMGPGYPFLDTSFKVGKRSKNRRKNHYATDKYLATDFSFGAGYQVFLSDNVGLYGQLSYIIQTDRHTDPVRETLQTGNSLGLFFGLRLYLL